MLLVCLTAETFSFYSVSFQSKMKLFKRLKQSVMHVEIISVNVFQNKRICVNAFFLLSIIVYYDCIVLLI